MQRIWDSEGFQSVLAALGRGAVSAALAYFAFLLKHVHDYETIIGTCGIVFLIPMAGLLHLVVPAIPGVPSMAARWPKVGRAAPPDLPLATGKVGHRIVPDPPTLPPPVSQSSMTDLRGVSLD